ncbi:MAG: D-alanine--D-alanine ligase [Anaerolineales bacterium]|nr:D-alanine--D-alanine ligase [Anaerolineales bacterium]
MKKMRIGILFGGRSGEHEVSIMSARSILEVIDRKKYEVVMIGITKQGRWICGDDSMIVLETDHAAIDSASAAALLADPAINSLFKVSGRAGGREFALSRVVDLDVIFPVLHGTYGEDGAMQGFFELADIAYVGSGVLGSAVAMDKGIFKSVMRAAGLPVLPAVIFNRSEYQMDPGAVINKVLQELTFPLFVKPVNLGSSVGVTKASNPEALRSGLDEAARWDRRLLVEQGIEAREIEVSVLGNDVPNASVAGEIVTQGEFYDYEAKYLTDESEFLIPAPIPEAQLERVRRLAVAAFKAADCAGMARVDFLLEKSSNELFLNELNTIPGFTNVSMYPKLWKASGLEYTEIIDRLIELALERKEQRDCVEHSFEVMH